MIEIRSEKEGDIDFITLVTDKAFGQEAEGLLVQKLRSREDFISELSIVACEEDQVIAHILFHPILIRGDQEHTSLALAPMSVLPEYQSLGIGGRLIVHGLSKASELGYQSVIVLGHAEYYPRFGFQRASLFNIQCPFEAPDEAFMAIELATDSLAEVSGTVHYPPEFSDV